MEFKLNDSLGFILNKTNTKLKNELLQRLKEYDVTPEQWAILNCLWEQEGVTPKELSDRIDKDKPNTNRILEKLQMKELIVRKPHPVDKRAFQIFLTDKGWAVREQLIPRAKELLDKATTGIDEHKVTELKNMLNQIYYNIK
ncbi:MarR family winged helix-turn-helix transcriptional regulator [Sporomusa sphaeroides]|uniref:MarR family winged helix-turn-helix transcriptional regulator n=1 Tax=Sporomusa sphaeroides TaxID=47679 RepID=UPI002CFF5CB8|nr:MarR family transcriptional regulator [Sporomusa sphaeroides]HML35607.1 MarR family transcriptional regulator [Sporomusa sphaeroides]